LLQTSRDFGMSEKLKKNVNNQKIVRGEGLGIFARQKIVSLSIFGYSVYDLPAGSLGNERLTNYLPFTVRDGGKEAMSDQDFG